MVTLCDRLKHCGIKSLPILMFAQLQRLSDTGSKWFVPKHVGVL